MLPAGLFLALLLASALCWRLWYVPKQVKRNVAAFKANGSQDDLQRGYHQRQSWLRVWAGLACCIVPVVPLPFASWWAALPGFFAGAVLLAGIFARYFTPLLNLARYAAGETHLSEWFASPASKSWPDTAAWVQARKAYYLTDADEQRGANILMQRIVQVTWRWVLVVTVLLVALTVWLTVRQ